MAARSRAPGRVCQLDGGGAVAASIMADDAADDGALDASLRGDRGRRGCEDERRNGKSEKCLHDCLLLQTSPGAWFVDHRRLPASFVNRRAVAFPASAPA